MVDVLVELRRQSLCTCALVGIGLLGSILRVLVAVTSYLEVAVVHKQEWRTIMLQGMNGGEWTCARGTSDDLPCCGGSV